MESESKHIMILETGSTINSWTPTLLISVYMIGLKVELKLFHAKIVLPEASRKPYKLSVIAISYKGDVGLLKRLR